MSWPYDYIIIGAGSAGCAIANRLAEDYALRILILEAGPPDDSFMLKMPAGFASLGDKTPYNWRYETTPQKHCNDRRMYWPRGKTLGGSSSINAMLYVRGHASDYDHWRQLGNEGWSYDDVLPYFKKAENNERGADDFHGTGGRSTSPTRPIRRKINEALPRRRAEQAGHKRSRRLQRRQPGRRRLLPGDAEGQAALERGQRLSAAGRRAQPEQRPRRSPTPWSSASSSTATAPWACATSVDGRDEVARCSREIILSGGAVNSPQLLHAVGHRPGRSPEVARHPRRCTTCRASAATCRTISTPPLLQFCKTRDTYDTANKLWSLYQYWRRTRRGPAPRRSPSRRLPQHASRPRARPTSSSTSCRCWWSTTAAPDEEERLQPACLHAAAREHAARSGSKSSDPTEHPLIDANYLAERRDLDTLIDGVKMGREIFAQSRPRSLPRRRVPARRARSRPTPRSSSGSRAKCETIYHPVGTCKMGADNDPMAVVDNAVPRARRSRACAWSTPR